MAQSYNSLTKSDLQPILEVTSGSNSGAWQLSDIYNGYMGSCDCNLQLCQLASDKLSPFGIAEFT